MIFFIFSLSSDLNFLANYHLLWLSTRQESLFSNNP